MTVRYSCTSAKSSALIRVESGGLEISHAPGVGGQPVGFTEPFTVIKVVKYVPAGPLDPRRE